MGYFLVCQLKVQVVNRDKYMPVVAYSLPLGRPVGGLLSVAVAL